MRLNDSEWGRMWSLWGYDEEKRKESQERHLITAFTKWEREENTYSFNKIIIFLKKDNDL